MEHSQNEWLEKAQLFELCAMSFRLPTKEFAEAVKSGDYAATAVELLVNLETIGQLPTEGELMREYGVLSLDEIFHRLRREYSRLFVPLPKFLIPPYAGLWIAENKGGSPLLYVSKRSLDIEHYMRNHGIVASENKNEPLDNIASCLEFLQYCASVLAGSVKPAHAEAITETTLSTFINDFLRDWVFDFIAAVKKESKEPFYQFGAEVLMLALGDK